MGIFSYLNSTIIQLPEINDPISNEQTDQERDVLKEKVGPINFSNGPNKNRQGAKDKKYK